MSLKNYRNSGVMVGQHFNSSGIAASAIDSRERDAAARSVSLMLLPSSDVWRVVPGTPTLEEARQQHPDAWFFKAFGPCSRDYKYTGPAFRQDVLDGKEAQEFLARVADAGAVAAQRLTWLEKRIADAAVAKGLLHKRGSRFRATDALSLVPVR